MEITRLLTADITPFAPQIKTGAIVFSFIIIDILTGLVKAFATHSYSSTVMREGLFHKLGELLCIAFGALCDILLPQLGVVIPLPIAQSVSVYCVIMETGSIVENIGIINPDLAKYLGRIFEKIQTPEEEDKDDDGFV